MKDPNLGKRVRVVALDPEDGHVSRMSFVGQAGQIVRGSFAHGYQVRLDIDAAGLSHPHLHPVAPPKHPTADEIKAGASMPEARARRQDEISTGRCVDCGVTHPAPAGVLHFMYAQDLVLDGGAALEAAECLHPVASGPVADDGCRDCHEEIRSGRSARPVPDDHPLHRPSAPRP